MKIKLARSIQRHEDMAVLYARQGLSRLAAKETREADKLRVIRQMRTEMLRAQLKKSIRDHDAEFEDAYTTGEHSAAK
jgi:hypothetical protein